MMELPANEHMFRAGYDEILQNGVNGQPMDKFHQRALGIVANAYGQIADENARGYYATIHERKQTLTRQLVAGLLGSPEVTPRERIEVADRAYYFEQSTSELRFRLCRLDPGQKIEGHLLSAAALSTPLLENYPRLLGREIDVTLNSSVHLHPCILLDQIELVTPKGKVIPVNPNKRILLVLDDPDTLLRQAVPHEASAYE